MLDVVDINVDLGDWCSFAWILMNANAWFYFKYDWFIYDYVEFNAWDNLHICLENDTWHVMQKSCYKIALFSKTLSLSKELQVVSPSTSAL